MGVKLIAPRLGELQRRYPDLRPVLLADTANRSLLRGEADIAVRLSRANESDLVARKIGTVEFGLYATRIICRLRRMRSARLSAITTIAPRRRSSAGCWHRRVRGRWRCAAMI